MPIQVKVVFWHEFKPLMSKNSVWIPTLERPMEISTEPTASLSYIDIEKIVTNLGKEIIGSKSDNVLRSDNDNKLWGDTDNQSWAKIYNIEWNPPLPDNLENIVPSNTVIIINVRQK